MSRESRNLDKEKRGQDNKEGRRARVLSQRTSTIRRTKKYQEKKTCWIRRKDNEEEK